MAAFTLRSDAMPLQSKLFAASKALQDCLVKDSAHLVPGTRGPHVELVQAALIRLRFLAPDDGLAEAGKYGERTAAAVLAFKRLFGIVNRSYQDSADNIVGKMTIAVLDHMICAMDAVGQVPAAMSEHPPWHPARLPRHSPVAPRRPPPKAPKPLQRPLPPLPSPAPHSRPLSEPPTALARPGAPAFSAFSASSILSPLVGAAATARPSAAASLLRSVTPGRTESSAPAQMQAKTAPPPAADVVGDADVFAPPLTEFPPDLRDTIWRSNLAKVTGVPSSMYPFVANHEGPLDRAELSRRFADPKFNADKRLLLELYTRMQPFGIWRLISTIRGIEWGTGSRGMKCHLHDHALAFNHMQALCQGPVEPLNPYLNDIRPALLPVMKSRFCRDAFNVHGDRDSWREIVSDGPGLHICVTNAVGRKRTDEAYPASDFHIDEIQQGQFCSNGMCVPLVNGQTIGHLQTVGPWLWKQPGEWLKKVLPK